jgi:hypothetical protein
MQSKDVSAPVLPSTSNDLSANVMAVVSREGVHGVAPVPTKILLLEGGNDEAVHRVMGQQRAKRVQARPAVPPDGGEKGQTHTVLIEEFPATDAQVGAQPDELTPRRHAHNGAHRDEARQPRRFPARAGQIPRRRR